MIIKNTACCNCSPLNSSFFVSNVFSEQEIFTFGKYDVSMGKHQINTSQGDSGVCRHSLSEGGKKYLYRSHTFIVYYFATYLSC